MKRIILVILLLLLSLSTNVFAQEGKTYLIGTFNVTFPANWEHESDSNFIKLTTPNQAIIAVTTFPMRVNDIDDVIMRFHNLLSKNKNISSLQLEEGGISSVDNLEARYRLYSINDIRHTLPRYHFMCFVHSEKFAYVISATGNYNDLDNDRNNIDDVISSIKILK